MNCRDLDALLFGGGELPPEARRHLATCARCRALAAALRDQTAKPLDKALLDRVRATVPPHLKPVKPLAPSWAFSAICLLIAAGAAAAFAAAIGFHGLPVLSAGKAVLIFGVLTAAMLLASFAISRNMRPGARTVRATVVCGLSFAAVELTFWWLFSNYELGSFVREGMACFRAGMICSVIAAALLWMPVRRGYFVAPVPAGATIGALSGLAGLTMLELHCPIQLVPHLMVWHAAVVVASAALGAAVGCAARLKPS